MGHPFAHTPSTPSLDTATDTENPLTPLLMRPMSADSLDVIDVVAGMIEATEIGYDSAIETLAIQLALNEWARGEESRALDTMATYARLDLTSAYRIIAAAQASPNASVRGAAR